MKNPKFRVYNRSTEKWIHGPGEEVHLFGEMILFGEFMKKTPIEEFDRCECLLGSEVPDRDGKEIFEGDVVLYKTLMGRAEYFAGMFILSYVDETDSGPISYLQTAELKIVGNIYDNPELL